MAHPELLFLCQTLPYPPDGGVAIRTFNVLRLLAREFDIVALCFYRSAPQEARGDVGKCVRALERYGEIRAFPIPQEQSRCRLVWDHVRSVALRRPYTAYLHESGAFRRDLQRLLEVRRFAVVHVDSIDLVGYLPLVRVAPIVCVHHNVESQLLKRRAAFEPAPWRRAYLTHQAELIAREERRWCQKVALNITVSEVDRHALQQAAPNGRFVVVPNGVDVVRNTPAGDGEQGIVFVGGLSWFPNYDALNYFAADILPLLQDPEKRPAVRWVGRADSEQRRFFWERYQIELTGYVEDVRPYLRDAACYVVPLRVGSGTRLKILEAWAMGKAVVSTSVGCEGLAAVDGDNILIRDSTSGFAEAVRAVLRDAKLRAYLGRNARATVERVYSWEVIGTEMISAYQSLAPDCPAGSGQSGAGRSGR